jgi:hypothetical protein
MPARRLLEEEDGDNALYTDFDVGEGRAGQGQSSSSVGSNTLKDAIAFVPPILMIAASQVQTCQCLPAPLLVVIYGVWQYYTWYSRPGRHAVLRFGNASNAEEMPTVDWSSASAAFVKL